MPSHCERKERISVVSIALVWLGIGILEDNNIAWLACIIICRADGSSRRIWMPWFHDLPRVGRCSLNIERYCTSRSTVLAIFYFNFRIVSDMLLQAY